MSAGEREKHVAELAERREKIQKEIQRLQKQREEFKKKEIERQGLDTSAGFDANLRQAIRAQGQARGMTFEN